MSTSKTPSSGKAPNTHYMPGVATYVVRFWMQGIGYARQERTATNAVQAGLDAMDELLQMWPNAQVVVISITRK